LELVVKHERRHTGSCLKRLSKSLGFPFSTTSMLALTILTVLHGARDIAEILKEIG
jgi:hypothetical protein